MLDQSLRQGICPNVRGIRAVTLAIAIGLMLAGIAFTATLWFDAANRIAHAVYIALTELGRRL